MTRGFFLALVVGLLAIESVAQFLMHDQELTTVSALLALAAVAVRWAVGPREVSERACPPNCPKCAESESTGGEEL
ncbi:hypothetical protein AB0M86_45180 [Streptomyces sp. NPDC051639]|uniref:hypothetical protein n=1 Tax=Streptomyces sp. NPDC051639 TaxID=3155671 RepID=UPI00342E937D